MQWQYCQTWEDQVHGYNMHACYLWVRLGRRAGRARSPRAGCRARPAAPARPPSTRAVSPDRSTCRLTLQRGFSANVTIYFLFNVYLVSI